MIEFTDYVEFPLSIEGLRLKIEQVSRDWLISQMKTGAVVVLWKRRSIFTNKICRNKIIFTEKFLYASFHAMFFHLKRTKVIRISSTLPAMTSSNINNNNQKYVDLKTIKCPFAVINIKQRVNSSDTNVWIWLFDSIFDNKTREVCTVP